MEIRSWRTDFRGRLLIHAGKTPDKAAMQRLGIEELPVAALIGSVSITDIEPLTPIQWRELAEHHLDSGPYQTGLDAWHVVEPKALRQPIPYRGDRGLFTVECERK